MILPNIIHHPDSGITIFIDTLQEIESAASAEIVQYYSSKDGSLNTFTRAIGPRVLPLTGTVSRSGVNDLRRKLNYLRGEKIILMLGAMEMATYGYLESFELPLVPDKNPQIELKVTLGNETEGQFWEAEDSNYGAASVDTPGPDSCMNYKVVTGTQYTGVIKEIKQDDVQLPVGDYVMFARFHDINQVTNDVSLAVYNSTDSTYPGSGTFTASSTYEIKTINFTIDSADVGDTIRFFVQKDTTTTNTISIDFFGFVRVI